MKGNGGNMAKDKNNFEQIREEITGMIARCRAADNQAAEEERKIRAAYEAAQQEKSAALESGSMEKYKIAGMKAEEKRLELEFIEKRKARGQEPGATVDDENRIRAALFAEYNRIRVDSFAQLKTLYTETHDVSADALRQFAALDDLFTTFEVTVMRNPKGAYSVSNTEVRLNFAQRKNAAQAELNSFHYINDV